MSRRTDRLPFAPAADWDDFELMMRKAIYADVSAVDVISDQDRSELAEASALTEALRLYDSAYHAEMQRWTAPYEVSDGIPQSALVSAAEKRSGRCGTQLPRHPQRRASSAARRR